MGVIGHGSNGGYGCCGEGSSNHSFAPNTCVSIIAKNMTVVKRLYWINIIDIFAKMKNAP